LILGKWRRSEIVGRSGERSTVNKAVRGSSVFLASRISHSICTSQVSSFVLPPVLQAELSERDKDTDKQGIGKPVGQIKHYTITFYKGNCLNQIKKIVEYVLSSEIGDRDEVEVGNWGVFSRRRQLGVF
jgi:hypothetical protein